MNDKLIRWIFFAHTFLHPLQDMLSPSFLLRMQARARQIWQQGYWWPPGAGFDKTPYLKAAVGR